MMELNVTRAITGAYEQRFEDALDSDVVVVGAGVAGLACAVYLAEAGLKTTVLERRLAVGGCAWGGGMGRNVLAFGETEMLDEFALAYEEREGVFVTGAVELIGTLSCRAEHAGACVFNLVSVEDVLVKNRTICGAVINARALGVGGLDGEPVCMGGRSVVDATGDSAELVHMLHSKLKSFFPGGIGSGFVDVEAGDHDIELKAGEVYPGLYVAGKSVCATFGLARTGPVFGGVLRSARKVAQMIQKTRSS